MTMPNGVLKGVISHGVVILQRFQVLPVHDCPGIREVSDNLNDDQHFLLDVDSADHLMQVSSCVGQKLPHLQIALQLMKLLHLREENINFRSSRPSTRDQAHT